jgi:hypothetical protein
MRFITGIVLISAAGLMGCGTATVGASRTTSIPKDAPATCSSYCRDMGLSLSAVVVMADNVGCVCAVPGAAGSAAPAAAPVNGSPGAAAGGMAALMLQAQSRKRNDN